MSDFDRAPTDKAITFGALSVWGPLLVSALIGVFGGGVTYATVRGDLAQMHVALERLESDGVKPAQAAAARVLVLEQHVDTMDHVLAQEREFLAKLEQRLDTMDHRLLVLVCRSDPKRCGDQ